FPEPVKKLAKQWQAEPTESIIGASLISPAPVGLQRVFQNNRLRRARKRQELRSNNGELTGVRIWILLVRFARFRREYIASNQSLALSLRRLAWGESQVELVAGDFVAVGVQQYESVDMTFTHPGSALSARRAGGKIRRSLVIHLHINDTVARGVPGD